MWRVGGTAPRCAANSRRAVLLITLRRMAYELTGLDNKVAVVTGAGRMRSIGRPIAEALADQTLSELGRVDIVVNNAGAARGEDRKPVIDLDPALWRTVIDVNLTGSFLMSKVFGRHLVASGNGGSIVNISSIAGKKLSPNTAAYAASKAGLQALTACMSREVAPDGVRVNAICPGVIDTSRMD